MKRIVGCLVALCVLMPGKSWAQSDQTSPLTCGEAQQMNNNGDTQDLVNYAANLYETWNDQAMQNGGTTVPGDDAAGGISFDLRICSGSGPQALFEDGVRASYQLSQHMNNLGG